MSFLDVTQRLNLRPLIMSKAQVDAIIADPNFYEIAFYVTLHKVGSERGIRTIRYALVNSVGEIYNFDGKPIVRSTPPFSTARFLNSGITFVGGFYSAVKIRRNPPPEIYFLNVLQTSLVASPNKFLLFSLEEVIGAGGAINYKLVANLSQLFGGGAGSDIPGGANHDVPPTNGATS
jgi:hypothetical protein